jgi:hypothetical protein
MGFLGFSPEGSRYRLSCGKHSGEKQLLKWSLAECGDACLDLGRNPDFAIAIEG